MSKKTIYYEDLPLKEMIQHHDFTYCMSDDNRAYENGRRQFDLIHEKAEAEGGWSKELVDHWNKYAPHSDDISWRKDYK